MRPISTIRSSASASTPMLHDEPAASETWMQRSKRQTQVAVLDTLGDLTGSVRLKSLAHAKRQGGRDLKLVFALQERRDSDVRKYLLDKNATASQVSDAVVARMSTTDMSADIEQNLLDAPLFDPRRHSHWDHADPAIRHGFRQKRLRRAVANADSPGGLEKIAQCVEDGAQTPEALTAAANRAVSSNRHAVLDILRKAEGFDPTLMQNEFSQRFVRAQNLGDAARAGDIDTVKDYLRPGGAGGVPQSPYVLGIQNELMMPTLWAALGTPPNPVAFVTLIEAGLHPNTFPEYADALQAQIIYDCLMAALGRRPFRGFERRNGKAAGTAESDARANEIRAFGQMLQAVTSADGFDMANFTNKAIGMDDLEALIRLSQEA